MPASRFARLTGGLVRVLSVLVLSLSLAACGGDDPVTPSETTGDGGESAGGEASADPVDVCATVAAEDVGTVLGETVEAIPAPPGGCQYTGATGESLSPLINVQEDGGDGLATAQAEAETALGGAAEPVTVGEASGFVVSGTLVGGSTASQGAVAVDGLIVSVTVTGGDPAGNLGVITQLLELALAGL